MPAMFGDFYYTKQYVRFLRWRVDAASLKRERTRYVMEAEKFAAAGRPVSLRQPLNSL
jgi:hypothetical protein